MSKHDEALKSALWELMQATGKRAKEARFAEATAALDALLAEHRAEVERLTAESRQGEIERQMVERQREWNGKQNEAASYERTVAALRAEVQALNRRPWVQCTTVSNECLGGCRSMAEHNRYRHSALAQEVEHLKRDKASLRLCYEAAKQRLSTARDAALEETALYFKDSEPGTTWGVNEAVSEVRALKSKPARQYVDAEKVREVLPYLRTVCGLSEQEVSEVLHRLGVDLDAKGECAGYECDVVPGDPCANCGLPFTQHPEHSP